MERLAPVYLEKKEKNAQREKMKILERNKLWRGEKCWAQSSSKDRESLSARQESGKRDTDGQSQAFDFLSTGPGLSSHSDSSGAWVHD